MNSIVLYRKSHSGSVILTNLSNGIFYRAFEDGREMGVDILHPNGEVIAKILPNVKMFYEEYLHKRNGIFFNQFIGPIMVNVMTEYLLSCINDELCRYVNLDILEEKISIAIGNNYSELLDKLNSLE